VGAVELLVAIAQFIINRRELFVGGLNLLFRALQFLIYALQLLIGGLDLLVGRLLFLIGSLVLLDQRPVPELVASRARGTAATVAPGLIRDRTGGTSPDHGPLPVRVEEQPETVHLFVFHVGAGW
jgi:hypothetical protein